MNNVQKKREPYHSHAWVKYYNLHAMYSTPSSGLMLIDWEEDLKRLQGIIDAQIIFKDELLAYNDSLQDKINELEEVNALLRSTLIATTKVIESKRNSVNMPPEIYIMLTDITLSINGCIREVGE